MVEVIESSADLIQKIGSEKETGNSIGFVPTMGALHQGHLSLVEKAVGKSDRVVVSIFVNPTQFNNYSDLEHYPRDLAKDLLLLEKTGCKYVFAPTEKEIYPEPDQRIFDFGNLDKVMEGTYRPGHFNGVAQVVSRLFDLVKPDLAFFGDKDFQQVAIIREMVRQEEYPVKIVTCPVVREKDGLAMSSRNRLLRPNTRKNVPIIAQTLFDSCNFANTNGVKDTIQFVKDTINSSSELEVEYFEIVDGTTLQPVASWNESDFIVGCIAVFADEVRLIDNVFYKKELS